MYLSFEIFLESSPRSRQKLDFFGTDAKCDYGLIRSPYFICWSALIINGDFPTYAVVLSERLWGKIYSTLTDFSSRKNTFSFHMEDPWKPHTPAVATCNLQSLKLARSGETLHPLQDDKGWGPWKLQSECPSNSTRRCGHVLAAARGQWGSFRRSVIQWFWQYLCMGADSLGLYQWNPLWLWVCSLLSATNATLSILNSALLLF